MIRRDRSAAAGMGNAMAFYAGRRALERVRESGLAPEDVRAVLGAAGGPKWLILGHFDRAVLAGWLRDRTDPLPLIGASSGAWRFAAACRADPVAATDRFEAAYVDQRYRVKPSPADVSAEGKRILDEFLGDTGAGEVVSHPRYRLTVIVSRSRGFLLRTESRAAQMAGFGAVALANAISRRAIGLAFDRLLVADPRTPLNGRLQPDGIPTRKVRLTADNLRTALLASGSIPLVMTPVRELPGAAGGPFWDGGVVDYHPDIPTPPCDGVILFPHYTDRIVPGWLDKKLTWRRPKYTDDLLMAMPSADFLGRLPGGAIPDRTDFHRFFGRDGERIRRWEQAIDLSRALAEDFMEAVLSGRIRERVRPMPEKIR